jgi:predicted anti-sigma-YlaC factor YlaD
MTNRDAWTARLSEYVDGELPADERVALERHLDGCDACRATVAELGDVRDAAATLPERVDVPDLWPGIAQRIGAAPATATVLPLRRRWVFTLPQLAAAAVLLMVLGAGGAVVALRGGRGSAPLAVTPGVSGGTPVAFAAQAPYDEAIADLERVLAEHRGQMDTATVRVLEESLATIDRAIARARAALAADPSDAYLNGHLAETMRKKLDLLRRAAALSAAVS